MQARSACPANYTSKDYRGEQRAQQAQRPLTPPVQLSARPVGLPEARTRLRFGLDVHTRQPERPEL